MRSGRRSFLYRMTIDNGVAPSCTRRLLSLAVGRSAVRGGAHPGDMLIGVASARMDRDHGLIYLARVTSRLERSVYFAAAGPYTSRSDCSYRARASARAGSGVPTCSDVLLSEDFRYFGASRVALARDLYPHLRGLLEAHGHGVRRHGAGTLSAELEGLIARVFAAYPDPINGKPTHRAAPGYDSGDDLDVVEA